ncbi:MAG: hypothetical protein WA210_18895 [Burkholderiaceae bacterium]
MKHLADAALLLACATVAAAQPPVLGRYTAQFCVAARGVEPTCGPAQIEWRDARHARVRISDIVYTLRLRTSQIDVVLEHGAMQIDGFTAIYEWNGSTLRFVDAEKNVYYEIRPDAQPVAQPEQRLKSQLQIPPAAQR